MVSRYEQIDHKRYDRALLNAAREAASLSNRGVVPSLSPLPTNAEFEYLTGYPFVRFLDWDDWRETTCEFGCDASSLHHVRKTNDRFHSRLLQI